MPDVQGLAPDFLALSVCVYNQGSATVKVCAEPGCHELTDSSRCPAHKPKPWTGRNGTTSRQARGIQRSGWDEQAEHRRILKTHGARCYLCGGPGVTQVDHVVPRMDGGLDTPANKRPICGPCHDEKSKAEAARARQTRG